MNNTKGLGDQQWFQIINQANNLIVELKANKLICSEERDDNRDSQSFKATIRPDGKSYSISSKTQPSSDVIHVWDYAPSSKLLIQKKQSSGERNNQSWTSEHVPGHQTAYFLISAPDCTHCLMCMGEGNQIKVVLKTPEVIANPLAHWKLVRLGPVVPGGSEGPIVQPRPSITPKVPSPKPQESTESPVSSAPSPTVSQGAEGRSGSVVSQSSSSVSKGSTDEVPKKKKKTCSTV